MLVWPRPQTAKRASVERVSCRIVLVAAEAATDLGGGYPRSQCELAPYLPGGGRQFRGVQGRLEGCNLIVLPETEFRSIIKLEEGERKVVEARWNASPGRPWVVYAAVDDERNCEVLTGLDDAELQFKGLLPLGHRVHR